MNQDFFDIDLNNNKKKTSFSERFTNFCNRTLTEKTFYIYIITCMIFIPIGEFITQLHGEHFWTQPVILEVYGILGIVMSFCWLLLNKDKEKVCASTIFYWTLFLFATISLICSKNILVSMEGYYYDEWFSHFLAYFSLMFLGSLIEKYEYRRNILFTFLGLALFESIICFMQSSGAWVLESHFDPEVHAASNLTFGLTQHQNFYAGLSVLFVGACIGTFLFCNNKKTSIIFGVLLAFTFYGSLRTSARIAWVGNFIIVFFYLISIFIVRKKTKERLSCSHLWLKYLIALLILLSVIVITISTWPDLQRELSQTAEEFADENIDRVGNGRFYIWRFGLESVPDNWLTGVGLDNYSWAFKSNPRFDINTMWYQSKGHNEYIHTLVTEGVPALINYLSLLVFASVTAIKSIIKMDDRKQQILTWIFFGMFTGYAAQAFVNSSVINTAMYFWVTIGMIIPKNTQKQVRINKVK